MITSRMMRSGSTASIAASPSAAEPAEWNS